MLTQTLTSYPGFSTPSSQFLVSQTKSYPWPYWPCKGPSAGMDSSTRNETAQTLVSDGSRVGMTRQCQTPAAAAAWAQWQSGSPRPQQWNGPCSKDTHWPCHLMTAGAGSALCPLDFWQPTWLVHRFDLAPSRPPAAPGCPGQREAPLAAGQGSGRERRKWNPLLPDCHPLVWAACWHRGWRKVYTVSTYEKYLKSAFLYTFHFFYSHYYLFFVFSPSMSTHFLDLLCGLLFWIKNYK